MKFLKCLTIACAETRLKYSYIGNNPHAIIVHTPSKDLFFINSTTSLNTHAHAYTADDKFFTYKLLEDAINMPETYAYLDPNCRAEYQKMAEFKTIEDIVKDVSKRISYSCIVKRNRGYHGINVFKCNTSLDASLSIEKIFNHNSKDYDYVALAQNYIEAVHEYRVVVLNKKIQFMYEKDTSKAKIVDNISPFHQENARAVLLTNKKIIGDMQAFIDPMFKKFPIIFAGLDVVSDNSGKLFLIEVNASPGFDYFIRDCGEDEVIQLYKAIFESCA